MSRDAGDEIAKKAEEIFGHRLFTRLCRGKVTT
jgi:hypothetical protein